MNQYSIIFIKKYVGYFTLMEIKEATNNFSDVSLIGMGGFGKVDERCMNDGTTLVAI